MGTWSWASVASRSLPSTRVRSHLSICPNDILAGQVDRSPPTFMQPNIRETTSSSTAAFTFADRKGEANGLPRRSSRRPVLEGWPAEFEDSDAVVDQLNGVSGIPTNWIHGVASLIAENPPPGVWPEHWSAFVGAARAFLDSWATKAAELGWADLDLFGADALKPEVAWLNSGAIWCAPAVRIVEVFADRIILETPNGSLTTFYRQPHMRARILPWEIT
jgi:hypothetical protein